MTNASELDEAVLARSRAMGCRLLADLIEAPPKAGGWTELSPRFEALGLDDEALAEQHNAVFDRDVLPRPSLWTGVPGDGVFLARIGFPVDEPDHLSAWLRAVAWLLDAEGDAQADGATVQVGRLRFLQAELLDEHVLGWLPAWVVGVERAGRPFPTAVAREALELLLPLRPVPERPCQGDGLDLDASDTGLAQIAEYLTTPVRCGLHLGPSALRRIGRELRLPGGFGGRTLVLANMLRAASRFDSLPALVGALGSEVDAWRAALPEGSACWQSRLDRTEALLLRLESAAA